MPTLLFFAQVSLVAPLANLVAVPLFTVWILPATLAGVVLTGMQWGAGTALLKFAAVGLSWLLEFLERLVTLPGATWQPGYMAWTTATLFCVGVVLCLLPRPFPGRLAALALLAIVVRAENLPAPLPLRVRVLDVGQGLAVLVQTPGHNLLYDAGGAWLGGDAGELIVVPALAAAGVRNLDVLMISHDDADHRGGTASILRAISVRRVLASGEQDYPRTVRPRKCRRGMHWQWEGVTFEILHPDVGKSWSENDASCVLLVRYQNSTLLLPGDIEAAAEFDLLRHSSLREVDLVLGPHHGSRTSSGAAFVRELEASFVIFSAGYANRWGFPLAEVVERWVAGKACVLATAASGALEFVPAAGGGFRLVAAARSLRTRPWPVRSASAAACISTINGVDGTV
jgi:competence protein ComEC